MTDVLLVGTTTDGTNGRVAGWLSACKFTAAYTGDVNNFRVYATDSGNVKVAIYSDDSGPDSRLAYNDSDQAVTGSQWNTLTISAVSLTKGTDYWLIAIPDTTGAISRNANTGPSGTQKYVTKTYSTWTWPANLSESWNDAIAYMSYSAWGDAINAMDFAAELPVPTADATFANTGDNDFLAAGELPIPTAAATFEQFNVMLGAGELPVPTASATFENLPNEMTSADGVLPLPVAAATFEQINEMLSAIGSFPMPTASAEFVGWQDPVFIDGAWAIYAFDAFGNDTDTPAIWERADSDLDLTPGDGLNSGTFPTFTPRADHATAFYAFDGVDDYISNWPDMPDEYTVIAAISDSYPDGQPSIWSCNDTTIQAALTTPGGYTGNVHSILIFDWELVPASLYACEMIMLRRLWRDTLVDPWTARMIRDEDCQLCLLSENETLQRKDYSLNAIGSTDYSTVWNDGLTFPVAGAAVLMDADAALNLGELTIFIEAPNFDTEATAETILQNGTNYVLSIATAAGVCSVTLNGSVLAFAAAGYRTLGVTVRNGGKPLFYANGRYLGEGDAAATVDTAGAGQLTIGNNTARNNPFASTLKKLSIFSEVLSPAQIRAAHFAAMTSRTWT